jgi:hypothetical protein
MTNPWVPLAPPVSSRQTLAANRSNPTIQRLKPSTTTPTARRQSEAVERKPQPINRPDNGSLMLIRFIAGRMDQHIRDDLQALGMYSSVRVALLVCPYGQND